MDNRSGKVFKRNKAIIRLVNIFADNHYAMILKNNTVGPLIKSLLALVCQRLRPWQFVWSKCYLTADLISTKKNPGIGKSRICSIIWILCFRCQRKGYQGHGMCMKNSFAVWACLVCSSVKWPFHGRRSRALEFGFPFLSKGDFFGRNNGLQGARNVAIKVT